MFGCVFVCRRPRQPGALWELPGVQSVHGSGQRRVFTALQRCSRVGLCQRVDPRAVRTGRLLQGESPRMFLQSRRSSHIGSGWPYIQTFQWGWLLGVRSAGCCHLTLFLFSSSFHLKGQRQIWERCHIFSPASPCGVPHHRREFFSLSRCLVFTSGPPHPLVYL